MNLTALECAPKYYALNLKYIIYRDMQIVPTAVRDLEFLRPRSNY